MAIFGIFIQDHVEFFNCVDQSVTNQKWPLNDASKMATKSHLHLYSSSIFHIFSKFFWCLVPRTTKT